MLHASPGDHEALVTVRRSFHTLKGSGRMVGLADLGEAGWAVEQVLNAWLHEARRRRPACSKCSILPPACFKEWVAQLEEGGNRHVEAGELIRSNARFWAEPKMPRPPAPWRRRRLWKRSARKTLHPRKTAPEEFVVAAGSLYLKESRRGSCGAGPPETEVGRSGQLPGAATGPHRRRGSGAHTLQPVSRRIPRTHHHPASQRLGIEETVPATR
jgi:hypothetical protein